MTHLERLTVALNGELYAESAGLGSDAAEVARLSDQLIAEYQGALAEPASREMALDGIAGAQDAIWGLLLAERREAALNCSEISAGRVVATWQNWKRTERELADSESLRQLFACFVDRSVALTATLSDRYTDRRKLYAQYSTTPLEIFARREHTTPEALRQIACELGNLCGEPFRQALEGVSQEVFGHQDVTTAAELHALYLNRMYEPLAPLFVSRNIIADVRSTFAHLGWPTDSIAMDLADRPNKYAGAFCFGVQIPGDVRVSIRPASPHHLADMLFHEFGHAVHFSGIDPDLPFADRYWIQAGTHETFATLFESLLGQPEYLCRTLGLNRASAGKLVAFDRFKNLLVGTWIAAAGATVCDAWLENLDWDQIEQRWAFYSGHFTGIDVPPGWARLDPFISTVDPYPLGYVLAAVRVAHWLAELEGNHGTQWWASVEAGQAIRHRIHQGGRVLFRPEWLDPAAFVARWIAPVAV